MMLKIAWRNVWRNPTRSLVVILAMFVGMLFGLFTSTFMTGWMQQRLQDGIDTETAHIQIHHPGFLLSDDLMDFIPQADIMACIIRQMSSVVGVSARLKIQAMIASAETATGVQVLGVDPVEERRVVNLSDKLVGGTWFDENRGNSIIIGQKLADELNIRLRSKIVLRLQDVDGNITGGAFRVTGIYKTINSTFDGLNVWVRKSDLQQLTLLPSGAAHELAIRVNSQDVLNQTVQELTTHFPEVKTQGWQDVSPELGYLTEIGNTWQYLMVVIVLLALGFGIVNTMLMVVLERIRELGMLMAIGMSRQRVFGMIVLESIMLSMVGGFAGILGGIGLTEWLNHTGVDLSIWGEGLTEWGFAPIVYPTYNLNMVVTIAIMVVLTGILASLYPAYKGLKLNPSDAIRTL